jgi:hypothetical protein
MAGPIIFISRNRILEGQRAAFTSAFTQAVSLIGSTKPRTALFAAYLDDAGSELRIVHVFPDAAAMAHHFEGSEQRAQSASGSIAPAGFEVYGEAPPGAVDQLRREAALAGTGLSIFGDALGGFLRPPA